MHVRASLVALATCVVLFAVPAHGQISLSTSTPFLEPLDGLGGSATATLPANFRADRSATSTAADVRKVGTFAAAGTVTTQVGGNALSTSASNGIYNFGAGVPATATDRAVGFVASGTATASGNLYVWFANNTAAPFSGLTISYDVEKYRNGSNASGFRMQLFYSTDGTTWTSAGSNFNTAFGADANNNGFTPAPGVTQSVIAQTLTLNIPAGSNLYLAWNYSVATGNTVTNAQALAIDNISVQAIAGPAFPTLSINDVSAQEGDSGSQLFNFIVSLTSPAPAGGVSFTIATQNNTATTADNDYIANSANVTIPQGGTSFTLPVTVNGDTNIEPNESFFVNVTNVTAGIVVAKSQGTGTILNDDTPTNPTGTGTATPPSLAAGDTTTLSVSVVPGTKPTSTGITVTGNLSSIGGSGAQSFSGTGNTFTFDAQVTPDTTAGVKTLPIAIADEQGRSSNASITVTIQTPPAPADHVVISQIYGGGGNSGATYTNDFVELYNPTLVPYDLAGWTIQYAAATGTSWANTQPLAGVIGPGQYFLITLASGGAVGTPLPTANIVGSINMGATAGKVALVHHGTPLTTCSDPDIVDFVGYGTTANCREGANTGDNAPAPSNTTAVLRKDNGATDTNNNHNDFFAGAPSPRRTAPITEVGPFVVSTDPGFNGTNAPHDATLNVNFSEPVDAVGSWYNVACVQTGLHNEATTAHTTDFKTWVITPNANFNFGESCTVTITANAIHDRDTDDSAPNTDTLPADYVWTFTVVAAGQPPPYAASVHMLMGNPNGADAGHPNNYLMMKPTYSLAYNRDLGRPNWVSWHLDRSWYGSLARNDTFRADPAVPPDWYRVQGFDFTFSGFDRGHMTPNADRDNENRVPINQETYLMSNMLAQAPDNNQGPWAKLENYLRSLTDPGQEIYIVSGPAGVGGTGSNGFMTTIANGHVTVPAYTWKVALVLPTAQSDSDPSRVTAATRTIAVIMPNVQGIFNDDWTPYLKTVRDVESLTGYNFYSNVPQLIQNCIEAGLNGVNPPCVADQSFSTREDTAGPITLNALSPTGAPLTYTFTQPAHGTLSGTGANQTYTPSHDFNGTDSFTFTVNDGHANSNTGAVTVTVLEVNDPPIATADSKSTNEDATLTFAASDLAGNDLAGPANESAQTLTVTNVSSTADTHGNLTFASGQISYTPDANFNGPATFTYQVCDNGVTVGALDVQCATGMVNITVVPVNDPPTIAAIDNKTVFLGDTLTFTAVGSDIDLPPQTLTYGLGATAPAGASIAPATGVFTWTPTGNQAGLSFTFDVIVSDGTATASTPVTVNVVDNTPPLMSALTLSDTRLWPPNHQMVNITVDYTVFDLGDASPSCVLTVSSSEPDNGLGDGDTPQDSIIVDANHVKLRAERATAGDGRIYTIGADCTDRFGNVAHQSAAVTVPKNNSK